MALAKQWNIKLPAEVSQAANGLLLEPTLNALEGIQRSPRVGSYVSPVVDHAQQQDPILGMAIAVVTPYAVTKKIPPSPSTSVDLSRSPLPDQSLPLQAHILGGRIDIAAILDVPNNEWDQLNRDGFRFASTNGLDLGSSAYNHAKDHWTQHSLDPCLQIVLVG